MVIEGDALTTADSFRLRRPVKVPLKFPPPEIDASLSRVCLPNQIGRAANLDCRARRNTIAALCNRDCGRREGHATAAVVNFHRRSVGTRLNAGQIPTDVCAIARDAATGGRIRVKQRIAIRVGRIGRKLNRRVITGRALA